MIIILHLMLFVGCQSQSYSESDTEYWYRKGDDELNKALKNIHNNGVAKNVILFLGDGMGVSTLTAARIFKGQKAGYNGEEGSLVFEDFPNAGIIKTYTVNKQVADSAATATAYLSGVKTNQGILGYNSKVTRGNCRTTKEPGSRIGSIAEWAIDIGKDAGVVTTARITHATPGALYAKSADRDWECSTPDSDCKDIGRQLVEDYPGNKLKVILGGGRQQLQQNPKISEDDKIDTGACTRNDQRDLIMDWKEGKRNKGESFEFVETSEQLKNVNVEETDYLLGIFANSHLPYEKFRSTDRYGQPSITDMTVAALKMLRKNDKGFVLLVEAGRIDHAHHANLPHLALEETVQLENAIKKTLELVDVKETLVLVTADHSHVMTISGYPNRGNPILDVAAEPGGDNLPYTTLSYTNGPGAENTYTILDGKPMRKDLTNIDTADPNYRSQAMVPMVDETHGGEDVLVYAIGPMSHLFHTLHEQSYIAHVISYSACIGPIDKEICTSRLIQTSDASIVVSKVLLILIALILSIRP